MCFLGLKNYSQNSNITNNIEKLHYKLFDSIIGSKNSELSLGPKYFNTIRTLENNHQYFQTEIFSVGNLVYNNQYFFDVKMKYDIHFDQVVIQINNDIEKYSVLPEKSRIKSFSINNKNFVNISNKNNNYLFVEKLKSGKIILYKKYFKRRLKKIDKSFLYSSLIEENYYLVSYKDILTEIRNKKDLKNLFPNVKKEINKLYREFKSNKNKDVAMINLITRIELLIQTKM